MFIAFALIQLSWPSGRQNQFSLFILNEGHLPGSAGMRRGVASCGCHVLMVVVSRCRCQIPTTALGQCRTCGDTQWWTTEVPDNRGMAVCTQTGTELCNRSHCCFERLLCNCCNTFQGVVCSELACTPSYGLLCVAPAQSQVVHRLPGMFLRCHFVCTTLQCCRFVCTTLQCCRFVCTTLQCCHFVCTTLQCCHFVCTTLQCCHFGHFLIFFKWL